MSRFLLAIGLAAAGLLSCGCGTVTNLVSRREGPKAFGGARLDCEVMSKMLAKEPIPGPWQPEAPGFAFIPFLDIPLSLVGDVVTYPLARWMDKRRRVDQIADNSN